MPLTHFKLADGSLVSVEDALEKGVLIDLYPTAYLRLVADQRVWKGKPSTTQLINGTRLAYLLLTTDYAEDPDGQMFRVHGTLSHATLEKFSGAQERAEQKFSGYDISGVLDSIEEGPDGTLYLTDYKRSGSYKIKSALGYVKQKRPMLDENGAPVLYKRNGKGYTAGQPRLEDFCIVDPAARDCAEWDDQLNFYRIIAEDALQETLAILRIFAMVRDGGTQIAKGYGLTQNTYMIPVPRLDNEAVLARFGGKRKALLSHMDGVAMSLETGTNREEASIENIPPACTKSESWDGRRCKGYCPVAEACRKAGGNPYFAEQGGDSEFKDF